MRLLSGEEQRKCRTQEPGSFARQPGGAQMSFRKTALAAAALSLAALASTGLARAIRLFGPDADVQGFRLVLQQRADHLRRTLAALEHVTTRQVEGRIFRMIAGHAAQPLFAQAVNDTADAGPVNRARA